jgi:hypothetical protein
MAGASNETLGLVRLTERQGHALAVYRRVAARRLRARVDRGFGPAGIDFVTSRKHCMNSSAAGLRVRFLSLTMA